MNVKATITTILIIILFSSIAKAQDSDKECLCQPLKESKENDSKVIALAEYIENSFHELETKGFDEKFHLESFVRNVTDDQNIDTNDAYTRGFMEGTKTTGKNLSLKIKGLIEAGAYYNLVNYRYIIEDQTYYFTFRLYSEDIGINYHDYKVCIDDKDLMFNDIYIYLTGEQFSETLKRIFLLSKPSTDDSKNLFATNTGKTIKSVLEAKKFAEQGNSKKAYKTIDQISGPMAKEKFILLLKAIYASDYNDKAYEKVLNEFSELFPNDPTLYLKKVDYHILKGEYTEALANIEKLIYETDDDFLNLMKGNIYMLKENFEAAETHYEYMTINYPALLEGHVGYMVSLNYQNRFEDMIVVVENLIDQGYEKEVLLDFFEEQEPDGSNALEAFVTSTTYNEWKRKS